ncbi:MAG: glucans biosynthesis glucosyltransferase MdoH [Variibacter sp.]|nr:glucans biosynthesis glucosyltransferase MdoH [Variibacter sp.]
MSDLAEELGGAFAAPGRRPALLRRRLLFALLVGTTIAGLLWLFGAALSAGGLDAIDLALLVLFGVTLPWTVIGFWNATIGFLVMRFAPDPVAAVVPAVTRLRGDEPITASVALLVFIRNEMPARVLRNIEAMLDGLAAAGVGERFHLYVLSDTSDPAIAAAEEASFGALARAWDGRIPVTYRRRADNAGFKAGNLRDFCVRWGDRHDLAVTLDADSFIPADAVLRMVRLMQVAPEIGILQGLVVGMPSTSAFARIFQFGMRLGMRSYTIGSAWWQGDCGPHWGHNSVLRLKPFIAHCHIPPLPGNGPLGGHVLSHDQIEAALMRRAGYEVRVLPEENLGWEENPPTLMEFIRRDLRWCQGNMQYWRFLFLPGLKAVSRYQLAFALLMFLGSPAWMGLLALGTLGVAQAPEPAAFMHAEAGFALLGLTLVMWFAPKIATTLDVLARPDLRRAFGGGLRFAANVALETAFFLLLSPIMWFSHTAFLGGLMFGRAIGWAEQTRDDHAVPFGLALRRLWPHMLFGWTAIGILAAMAPEALPYALLIAGGLALAAPFAVLTADPRVGAALARLGIGRLPEEEMPTALRALRLPALALAAAPASSGTAEATQCSQS